MNWKLAIAGTALAVGAVLSPIGKASADQIEEDSPAWDCRYDGNRICGPGNPQGFTPGWYGDDNCWPGAIYCPPAGTPEDITVTVCPDPGYDDCEAPLADRKA